jgi:hypothetical protein
MSETNSIRYFDETDKVRIVHKGKKLYEGVAQGRILSLLNVSPLESATDDKGVTVFAITQDALLLPWPSAIRDAILKAFPGTELIKALDDD